MVNRELFIIDSMSKQKLFLLASSLVLFYANSFSQWLYKDSTLKPSSSTPLIQKDHALNFIVMGDWGRVGADHQKEVALQMGKTAAESKAEFIIAAGDNFYPSGVISEMDPLFRHSFEDIYTAFSLQWDWYPVLGNHDYKSNPGAQVKYSRISRRWQMPARYYAKIFSVDGDTTNQVLILFIDTNPLIPEFYKNPVYGPNVATQDSSAQKRWMISQLAHAGKNIKWKLVVGHHPMFTGGSRTDGYDTKAIRNSLLPVFNKYHVDVYISGHEHSLQHLVTGKLNHLISGSASEKTPVKLVPESLMSASDYGFMLLTASADELTVQAINENNQLIYRNTLKK